MSLNKSLSLPSKEI